VHSACRPAVFRRCGLVAVVVGTALSLLNQGDAIFTGRFDGVVVLRIVGNFVIPFIVSNVGAMTSLPSSTSTKSGVAERKVSR
jgi:hypothetical protein